MAGIAPGLGGSFKSATAEARALDILMFVQFASEVQPDDIEQPVFVRAAIDTERRVIKGDFTLPVSKGFTESGALVIEAEAILQDCEITPGGDNPTFKSKRPEAHLLEVFSYIQRLEQNPAKNPDHQYRVTAQYSSDLSTFNCSFSLPLDIRHPGDGSISISAQPYLL